MRDTVTFGITVKVIIIVTLQVVGRVNQVAFLSEIKCVRYETQQATQARRRPIPGSWQLSLEGRLKP